MSASELAELANASPQALTRPLQALEREDYIGRREDDDDRRRAVLWVTPKGEDFVLRTMRKRVAWLSDAINNKLAEDERTRLREAIGLLERLVDKEGEPLQQSDLVFNLIPFTRVADVDRSVDYYGRLGFVVDGEFIKDGKRQFASMHATKVSASRIFFQCSCAPIDADQQKIFFYCWTDDVVALHARLAKEGYEPGPIESPDHMESGEFTMRDPDGYLIAVGQPKSGR
jgi:DNA-binding MarR family transcriptional regulator